MSKGIRALCKSVFIVTVAAIGAAMLVDFSLASPRRNVPATKRALSGLSAAMNQPAGVAGSPANQLIANYGKLPLTFEANQGQLSGPVKFLSHGQGYALFLTGDEAVLSFQKAAGVAPVLAGLVPGAMVSLDKYTTDQSVLHMKLIGASAGSAVTGADELAGKSNYFIGNDPTKWLTNVPNYAKVRYQGVYPGVDLVYYGSQGGQLEYDFVVAPGADAHAIGLSLEGAGKIRIDKGTGDLVLVVDGSELQFRKPVVYQPKSGSGLPADRQPIASRFVLTGKNHIGFQLAAYDHRAPLIIDPVLVYSTYLGGGQYTVGYRVAVDSAGSAYVAGATNSTDFPTTTGVFKSPLNAGGCAVRVSSSQPKKIFTCPNAFVTKLDSTGTQLVYSTYLGGSASDAATGISVDSSGDAYVTGSTGSTDFPTTTGAFQTSATDSSARTHAFATKLNPTGSALTYSTYLAGTHDDVSTVSAIDSNGNLYVAGGTTSKDFPTTTGAFQRAISGTSCHNYGQTWPCTDGFITKLNQGGTALVYSTYLGGNNHDVVLGLAVDSTGSAYVTGVTASTNFPTADALQSSSGTTPCGTTPGGNPEPCFFHAFVTKLNSTGTALDYSTYLGGNGHDGGLGIAVDGSGAAYVTGATNSTNFPTTTGAAQTTFGGGTCGKQPSNSFDCPDAFVAKLEPSGTSLAYSTYLGGSSFDFGWGIAVDSTFNAYVVGGTDSTDFPTDASVGNFQGGSCSIPTAGIFQTSNGISGYSFNCPNAFLTVIDPTGATRTFSTYLGGASGDFAFSVAIDGSGGTYVAGSTISSNFPVSTGALQTSMSGYVDAFISKFGPATATGPVVSVSSPPAFPAQVEQTTSSPQTATVTNAGNGSLSFTTIAITGPFAIASSGTTCSTSTPVAAASSCTVAVTFTPTAVGSASGSLSFTDNAPNSPQTVTLSGTGQDFSVTSPTGSPTSITVAPGSPASYTLSVGGSSGMVNFACTGAPSESTCTVSPSPAPAGTNVTVKVPTTAASMGAPRSRPISPVPPLSPGLKGLLMLALILAATAWAILRRRQAGVSRWQSAWVPLAAGLMLALALAGCGGGGGGGTTTVPGTPAGTYTLTVTGTTGSGASAVTHSATLTLIVS